jgi:hypothetical protein
MPSDINPIPHIDKTTAHNTSEKRRPSRRGSAALLTSSPYKNNLMKDLEMKAGNDKKQADVKQNQLRKGKQGATNGPTRKGKREVTLPDAPD